MTLSYSNSINRNRYERAEKRGNLIPFSKFGYNPAISTIEDIWSSGGTLTHATTARTQLITSTSAADNGSTATGALTLRVQGLDANWNELQETVTLDGITGVTTTGSYIRVLRMFVETIGSGGVNAGAITSTSTTDSTIQAHILTGTGQTAQSHTSVPADYEAHIERIWTNVGKGDDADIIIQIREFGKSWRTIRRFEVYQTHISVELQSQITLPPKSDMRMRAIAGIGSIIVSAGYDYDLVAL